MLTELTPEQYREGLKFVEDDVRDIFLRFDLTTEDTEKIKAYKNNGGIMVVWKDDTAVLNVKEEKDALDLLKTVPKDSRWTFLVDRSISPLLMKFFDRREEKYSENIYSINYVTKESFMPLKDKIYEVTPLSDEYASEIAKLWPFARGKPEFVRSLISRWPAYTILHEGVPTSWGSVLLKVEGDALTGMWYTVPKYRGQGRMTHIVSKIAEETLEEGDFLRADIKVDNLPSLAVARSLGFKEKGTYSRLEPV